ncbi:hypothetical protein B0H14DRAFT_3533725 [Mycena olivaceomarginata]|nr:hypothetical protein B0H14DRAFT_3533725 [Mycena olivaceomarginata]
MLPAGCARVLLQAWQSPPARISSALSRCAYLGAEVAYCVRLTNTFRFCFHFTCWSLYVIACINQPLIAADLRLASLTARGIAANLSHHADGPTLSPSDMEQHLLLCERLQAVLALHGRHPSRMLTGIVPPTYPPSVLLSGRLPLLMPAPSAPLCCIATAGRARSSSHGSASVALEMPTGWRQRRARGRRVRGRGGCWRGGH